LVRVIVTRPAAQAAQWAYQLEIQGVDAVALPLMSIAAVEDTSEVVAAWYALQQRRLVVFVSPNAAEQFFARRPETVNWPAGVLAGAPGPGTSRALVNLGVPVTQIIEPAAHALQFDSETLWEQLSSIAWGGQRVLIVRGEGGRNWLADTLKLHGADVQQIAAYRRSSPNFDNADAVLLRAALELPEAYLWFFSSSEAIGNLVATVTNSGKSWANARAIVTHPRIAQRAQQAGFVQVTETQPSFNAVLACIQSLRF
jgi:uroporphyrinogen-III synthase